MACNDPECSDDAAIRESIERIAYEAHHLREDMAALKALGQARERVNCPFMLVASSGLQSDLLARLARVLERDGRVGSFWFLHRRGVIAADRRTIKFLSDIADRLQPIRNKVFAHIDKEVLRDPQKPYRDADLHWLSEIEPAIAKISELITRVYETRTGSEGWRLLKTDYDDGGISGGTMERPSLQRLLEDIRQELVDVVVVDLHRRLCAEDAGTALAEIIQKVQVSETGLHVTVVVAAER